MKLFSFINGTFSLLRTTKHLNPYFDAYICNVNDTLMTYFTIFITYTLPLTGNFY